MMTPRSLRRCRRGATLVYATIVMLALMGLASLAYEFGKIETIKNEMQGCADATALATMGAYAESGYNQVTAATAAASFASKNYVDKLSGVSPTVTYVGGTWNSTTRTFSTTGAPGYPAVKVVVARTSATGNAVPLNFGALIKMPKVDVQAQAIAVLVETDSAPVTLPATSNPYLGGMPAGSTGEWGDNMTNAKAIEVTGISVVPGTWITVTSVAGTTSILPGYVNYVGPEGEAARPLHHGENYDHSNYNIGPENGIADAIMPADAMMGIFLTDAYSNATPAPAGCVDWTAAGVKDQPQYTTLQVKAPFLIGDGKTSGGTVQKFLVPPGATRLVLGVWDGTATYNNGGSLTATFNLKRSIRLVK